LLGKDKTAELVIKELKSQKENLESLLKSVLENEKKSAYIVIQNSKGNLFRTLKNANSLALANISNSAASASKVDEWGFAEVSKEEFLNWNPDFIFLDKPLSEKAISKKTLLDNDTYRFLSAVKNNQIYVTHSFSCPKDYAFVIAEAYYYAHVAYPEKLSEKEYRSAINSIFEKTYGIKNYYEEWEKYHQ
jgi:iron complex transport system substrate-binding protein